LTAVRAWSLSSAFQISASAFFAPGCADFSSAPSTFAILWNQWEVSGADIDEMLRWAAGNAERRNYVVYARIEDTPWPRADPLAWGRLPVGDQRRGNRARLTTGERDHP
jgi:hypothetical protein